MASFATKAGFIRGLKAAAERRGVFERVLEKLPPNVRPLFMQPPPPSTWVEGPDLVAIELAIEAAVGSADLRDLAREAVTHSSLPLVRSITEGLVRLFGATPETFLSRVSLLSSHSSRGFEHVWRSTSKRSGELIVTVVGASNLPACMFHAMAGSLLPVFDLTNTVGHVDEPEFMPCSNGIRARLRVSWSPR